MQQTIHSIAERPDVVAVLDALGIEKAHYWGYSMGGWIGFGMAKYSPQRVNKPIIGGQHPYARDQSGFRHLLNHGIADGPEALVAAYVNMAGPLRRTMMRAADLHAWLAAVQDRAGIEDVLVTMAMPCCLYAGESDPVFAQAKSASERISNARFISLPGLSHFAAFVESRSVLPRVMEFLGD